MFRMPLQLNWKMKHVSVALFLARFAQIVLLVSVIYFIAPASGFSHDALPVAVFLAVLASMVLSALTELLYTYRAG